MFETAVEDTWTICVFTVLIAIIAFGACKKIKYVKKQAVYTQPCSD